MQKSQFEEYAANETNQNWERFIRREKQLYGRDNDIRSEFARDYTRILHCMAYRRLKHKTQVFFNIDNDHICTRMEHVSHVESVSTTISRYLGLNEELTRAIAIGHDLGHAPFGHQGEAVLRCLSEKHLGSTFWHEKNGIRFADKIELLEDTHGSRKNLDLTYAVRDGIISHCGEVESNGIHPRSSFFSLEQFESPGAFQPATWEGCVVKMSDKIAYIGRDIEDAEKLGIIDDVAKKALKQIARVHDEDAMNTTVIMHNMIVDICKTSSPDSGILLSSDCFRQLQELMSFNEDHIYKSSRLGSFRDYSALVINQIFSHLDSLYDGRHTFDALKEECKINHNIATSFMRWLAIYCNIDIINQQEYRDLSLECENEKIYGDLSCPQQYEQAILDFISGMTDRFAIALFNELIAF
jgi:dGTPase